MMMSRCFMTGRRYAFALLILMALALWSSGCCSFIPKERSVVDIKQHPKKEATIVETREVGCGYNGPRFWHCNREGDDLMCKDSCGDDPKCAENPGAISADRSGEARMSIDEEDVEASERSDESEKEEAQEPRSRENESETEQFEGDQ